MYSVMNDPGHGGVDPGATGNGYKEKDLVLKLALGVDEHLRRHGLKSHLTRKDDRFIPLGDRSKKANNLNVDAFISYHFNSFSDAKANGTETFHFPRSNEGHVLASKIQNELIGANLVNSNRGVKSANFSVLRRTEMKSVLIEVCFISNKNDMDFFIKNYDKYVQAITKAIVEHGGVKYIPPIKGDVSEEIVKPSINIVDGKVNILLLSENVAIDGFFKEGTGYVNINDNYIAAREIFESMGLNVGWDKELGVITADTSSDYKRPDNSTKILLLGNRIDVETYIHKDKHCLKIEDAYIPIRDIFEGLGFNVSWNGKENMILITK